MRLDALTVQLRRRTEWDAMELGRAMLRAWRTPIFRTWITAYVPVMLVLTVATWPNAWLAVAVLWWLEPVFERLMLHVCSQQLFGVQLSPREALAAWPTWLRHTGLLWSLTIGRLSPTRSLVLPVRQLERQKGRDARARASLLRHRAGTFAWWLTTCSATMWILAIFGQLLCLSWLMPAGMDGSLSDRISALTVLSVGVTAADVIIVAAAALATTLVTPLFVTTGFALYLNRRTELEAWDIEVAFRSVAEREKSRRDAAAGGLGASAATFVVLISLMSLALGGAQSIAHAQSNAPAQSANAAQSNAPAPSDTMAPQSTTDPASAVTPTKATLLDVLRDPVFGTEQDVREWRWKARKPQVAPDTPAPWWLGGLQSFIGAAARSARALLVVLAVVATGWFLVRLARQQEAKATGTTSPVPSVLFGLDVRPEALPSDVVAAAKRLIAAGNVAGAVALLYRAALVALVHGAGVTFADGDTERDCLRRAGSAISGDELAYFESLVTAWQHIAYAHAAFPGDRLERLCDEYPDRFRQWGNAT